MRVPPSLLFTPTGAGSDSSGGRGGPRGVWEVGWDLPPCGYGADPAPLRIRGPYEVYQTRTWL